MNIFNSFRSATHTSSHASLYTDRDNITEIQCGFTLDEYMTLRYQILSYDTQYIMKPCEMFLFLENTSHGTKYCFHDIPRPICIYDMYNFVENVLIEIKNNFKRKTIRLNRYSSNIITEYDSLIEKVCMHIGVIRNRIETADFNCIICFDKVTLENCLISTCCYNMYCLNCIGDYRHRFDRWNSPGEMVIRVNSPCCGQITWLPKYSTGPVMQSKRERIKLLIHALTGKRIVIYFPIIKYAIFKNCVYRSAGQLMKYNRENPFITSDVLFTNDWNVIECKYKMSTDFFIFCADEKIDQYNIGQLTIVSRKTLIFHLIYS